MDVVAAIAGRWHHYGAVSATIGSPTTVADPYRRNGSVQVTVNNGSGPVEDAGVNLSG